MRKKLRILIFSKMAPTILIKFCGFIVLSTPNNLTLSAFPEKIRETRKIVFNFLSVASKLRVVHVGKKFKIFIFSKMAPTIFIKFSGFIVQSNPNIMTLSAFPGKILLTRKIFFKFSICHLT